MLGSGAWGGRNYRDWLVCVRERERGRESVCVCACMCVCACVRACVRACMHAYTYFIQDHVGKGAKKRESER